MSFQSWKALGILVVATILWVPLHASALEIKYTSTFEGGSSWRLDYTLTGQAGDPDLKEFTIFFDRTRFGTLSMLASPSGWDSIVVQADSGLAADGYLDSLSLGTSISAGQQVTGLAISVMSLVPGAPGRQFFQVVDPATFDVLDSGFTVATGTPPQEVPEPNALALSALALLAMRSARRLAARKGA